MTRSVIHRAVQASWFNLDVVGSGRIFKYDLFDSKDNIISSLNHGGGMGREAMEVMVWESTDIRSQHVIEEYILDFITS